jgi:zinc protease
LSEPAVHYEVLPNGLTLLLREAHVAPVANLQIWAKVGSADERPGEEGLAHFHEHMLFKGTKRRGVGDVAGEVEGAGGRINAYTSFDVTVYYATLPSDALDTGLDVLVDALRHSVFDPVEVQREVEVVLEEIRRSDDSPGHVLSDLAFSTSYQVHPYRKAILGTAENVARFDKPMVEAFFRRWYTPDNLMVVAAGDFEAGKLAERIRRLFADADSGGTARGRAIEPEQHALRTAVLVRPFERARLDLSWRAPSFREVHATHLDLLAFILGEAESSRLVRNVKETRGLADRIDASCYTPLDPGLFSINLECEPEQATAAVEAVLEQVERLRCESVSRDELERARANFLATEHFERESVSGMASKLGHFHVMGGDYRSEERYFESVRHATPDDLRRVASQYLAPEKLTACALLPEADGAVPALDEASLGAAIQSGTEHTRRTFAVPRRVPSSPNADAAERIATYPLAGGAVLHVMPTRDVPVVSARAALLGGLLSETEQTAGLTSFTSSMWMRGTRSHSAAGFARAVENLAAEVDSFSGRSSLGVTLECTSDKLEPALDLFAQALLEPAFDPTELERERRDVLASIERRADRLAQRCFLLFQRTLFEHHPYRHPISGVRESVEAFDAAAVQAHHERLIRADNLVLGVAGDVDPDAIAQACSVRFAALGEAADAADALQWPALEPAPSEPRTATEHADRAQAHLVVGYQGLALDDPDRFALELVAQILAGQSGRLFLELRDRQGLAYSVSAMNVEGLAPGFFAIYIATAPEKREQARRGIELELERLVQEPVTAPELERAKRYLIGNHAIDRQRSAARAASLALDGRYGLGIEAALRYPEHLEALTRDDLLRVAQRVMRPDSRVEAAVCP